MPSPMLGLTRTIKYNLFSFTEFGSNLTRPRGYFVQLFPCNSQWVILPSKPDISLTRFIESVAPTTPSISISDAIPRAEAALNGKYNNHPPTLEYFAKADGTAVLAHVIQIENDTLGTWFEAFVDAHSGDLVSVTDFVARASVRRFLVLYLWQF